MEGAYDALGDPSEHVRQQGSWNAALETGLPSALDDAILRRGLGIPFAGTEAGPAGS